MAHDVFISYSSKDKTIANAVCATLEKHEIRCWIAPRDVPPGLQYAAALVSAINDCKVFVLVFSKGSNASGQVLREVEEAVDNGIPIIPLRIEDFEPTEAMRFYIKSLHWLDAMTPPLEQHLGKLVASVQALLSIGAEEQPPPVAETVIEAPVKKRWPLPAWSTALLVLAGVVIVGGVGSWVISQLGSSTDSTTPTDTASPTEVTSIGEVVDKPPDVTSTPDEGNDWRPLSFMIPNPQLWKTSGEISYTAVEPGSYDAFAWSTEIVEGDLTVSLDLESPGYESSGCVIVYGGGIEHSYGSLIFCVEWDFYTLEKHTTYHDGENFVSYSPSNIDFADEALAVTIEIQGDVASMFVNGQKVLSTFFDTEEISGWGRIGLHKKSWISPEITFSNIKIKTPSEIDQELSTQVVEDFECELDTGSQANYYPIQSPFIYHSINVDGEISSHEEWADAPCVDFRLHYSINVTNPNFQRARWWVQNDGQDLFFLVRVSKEMAVRGVFINYWWPEYTGTWAHSDGVYARINGENFDHGEWDEMQWHEDKDLDPPGTVDVEANSTEDGEFYWFEVKRALNSGDSYDWVFEPGQKYGANPYDSVMIGMESDDGTFLRYIQLELGEP